MPLYSLRVGAEVAIKMRVEKATFRFLSIDSPDEAMLIQPSYLARALFYQNVCIIKL